jgi:preprotein translocase subunit SecG
MNSIILSSETDGLAKMMAILIILLFFGLISFINNFKEKNKNKNPDFEEITKEENDKINDKHT